ncbi:hypothetical protein SteCoe_38208 [Stentor coeruleus]|uniref:THH1/TOM1/TOM3 domain-containing protein n=1 Tax=Stentor coeruleus TaxID=5963 RepID=A0A1R2ALZ7_9CILI|nr:hypothetical protein SteCoe_38208 [Stentor coeruleus]
MKELQDESGELFDLEITGIFLAIYGLLSLFACLKSIRCIRNMKAEYNYRILWFYFIINSVTFLRIVWCLNYFGIYSENTYNLLDCLSSATLELLGYTFIVFWLDIYIDIDLFISKEKAQLYSITLRCAYALLSVFTYAAHIYLIYFQIFSINSIDSVIYFSAFISIFVSIALIISGRLLVKKINLVYSQSIGEKVNKRVKLIIIASSFIYISKSCLFITAEFTHKTKNFGFDIAFMFIYVIGTEIFPLCSVLYFLKPNLLENSSLNSSWIPSGLRSEKSSLSKVSRIFKTFMKSKVFENTLLDYLESDHRSLSLPATKLNTREFVKQKSIASI